MIYLFSSFKDYLFVNVKYFSYYVLFRSLILLYRRHHGMGGSLFADFQALQRIWTHPIVLRLNAEKIEKANEKKGFSSDTEGSLKDFINDDSSDSDTSSSNSSNDSEVQTVDDANVPKRKTRNNPGAGGFLILIHMDVDLHLLYFSSFLYFLLYLGIASLHLIVTFNYLMFKSKKDHLVTEMVDIITFIITQFKKISHQLSFVTSSYSV